MKSAEKNDEANEILLDIKKIDETLDNAEVVCAKTDGLNMTLIVLRSH